MPYLKRINSLPLINHISYKYAQVSDIGPSWSSCLKTLWEKEKLLVMSNCSFSHSIFYPFRELSGNFIKLKIVVYKLVQFGRVQDLSFRKNVNTYQTTVTFHSPGKIQLLTTMWEKEKNTGNYHQKQILVSPLEQHFFLLSVDSFNIDKSQNL